MGEDQILAQLKGALAAAQAAHTAGPYLHRLAHMALTAGKQARARTAIGRHHLSVVSVALRLAAGRLGDLGAQRVLVVGGGQTAELALKHLAGRPAALLVANRTAARGTALAAAYGAVAYPWDALEDAVAAADVVVSATSAPGAVLDAPLVARARARRPERPLLLLDLALPRDVDPACAALPGVDVADLDSLQAIAAENRRRRAAEIAQAEAIIAEAVERFAAWWRARAAVPAIVALRGHAEAVRDAEVARTLARLPDLTPEEADAVRYLATALVNKLMHAPTTALKAAPADAPLAAALHTLFALPETADGAPAAPAVDQARDAAAVWVPASGHADDREELHP